MQTRHNLYVLSRRHKKHLCETPGRVGPSLLVHNIDANISASESRWILPWPGDSESKLPADMLDEVSELCDRSSALELPAAQHVFSDTARVRPLLTDTHSLPYLPTDTHYSYTQIYNTAKLSTVLNAVLSE